MSLITQEPLLLIFIAIVLALGLIFHLHYFVRITSHVKNTSSQDKSFLDKDLRASLRIPQGSNFYTVMILSWCMFLIAFAFLFFLTPNILNTWNFFESPALASDSFGIAYFGIAIVILPGILVAIFVPRSYRYCLISENLKKTTLMAPALLFVSILCSVYLGTIYPEIDSFYWYLGYIAMVASLIIMLSPITISYIEEMRV